MSTIIVIAASFIAAIAAMCTPVHRTIPSGAPGGIGASVAIGDSITRTGSPDGWVSQYLGTVGVTNAGHDGISSYELAAIMGQIPVAGADRVTLFIGTNDYIRARDCETDACIEAALDIFTDSLYAILGDISRQAPCAEVVVADLYDLSYLDAGDERLRSLEQRMNAVIHGTGEEIAPVAAAFGDSSGLILADAIHPNEEGHRRIAEAFKGTEPQVSC